MGTSNVDTVVRVAILARRWYIASDSGSGMVGTQIVEDWKSDNLVTQEGTSAL